MNLNSRRIAIAIALVTAILSFQITPVFGNQQNKRSVNKRRIQNRGTRPKISGPVATRRSASANGQRTPAVSTGQVGNATSAPVSTDSGGQSSAAASQPNGQSPVKPLGKSPSTPNVGAAATPPKRPKPIQ